MPAKIGQPVEPSAIYPNESALHKWARRTNVNWVVLCLMGGGTAILLVAQLVLNRTSMPEQARLGVMALGYGILVSGAYLSQFPMYRPGPKRRKSRAQRHVVLAFLVLLAGAAMVWLLVSTLPLNKRSLNTMAEILTSAASIAAFLVIGRFTRLGAGIGFGAGAAATLLVLMAAKGAFGSPHQAQAVIMPPVAEIRWVTLATGHASGNWNMSVSPIPSQPAPSSAFDLPANTSTMDLRFHFSSPSGIAPLVQFNLQEFQHDAWKTVGSFQDSGDGSPHNLSLAPTRAVTPIRLLAAVQGINPAGSYTVEWSALSSYRD